MKKNQDEKAPENESASGDISSTDIRNAHAAGDGSMGRNDEKLEEKEEPGTTSDLDETAGSKNKY